MDDGDALWLKRFYCIRIAPLMDAGKHLLPAKQRQTTTRQSLDAQTSKRLSNRRHPAFGGKNDALIDGSRHGGRIQRQTTNTLSLLNYHDTCNSIWFFYFRQWSVIFTGCCRVVHVRLAMTDSSDVRRWEQMFWQGHNAPPVDVHTEPRGIATVH